MGIFVGDTSPSKIFVGGSEVASVWAGDTKIRPKIPAFVAQTFNYRGRGRQGQEPATEEHTITFEYPYDNIVIDYSLTGTQRYGRIWLKILKNGTQIYSHETYSESGTDGPISVGAGDVLKIQFGGTCYSSRTRADFYGTVIVKQSE